MCLLAPRTPHAPHSCFNADHSTQLQYSLHYSTQYTVTVLLTAGLTTLFWLANYFSIHQVMAMDLGSEKWVSTTALFYRALVAWGPAPPGRADAPTALPPGTFLHSLMFKEVQILIHYECHHVISTDYVFKLFVTSLFFGLSSGNGITIITSVITLCLTTLSIWTNRVFCMIKGNLWVSWLIEWIICIHIPSWVPQKLYSKIDKRQYRGGRHEQEYSEITT